MYPTGVRAFSFGGGLKIQNSKFFGGNHLPPPPLDVLGGIQQPGKIKWVVYNDLGVHQPIKLSLSCCQFVKGLACKRIWMDK